MHRSSRDTWPYHRLPMKHKMEKDCTINNEYNETNVGATAAGLEVD